MTDDDAAHSHAALRKEMKQLKCNFLGLTGVTLLLVVGTVVASYFAFEASKDTATNPETGVMMAYGSPVSVNTNELKVPLAALPFLPVDVVEHVKSLNFLGPVNDGGDGTGEEGSSEGYVFRYHRSVAAIDVADSARLVVTTTVGDSLVWPSADGNEGEITVTLADGTSWNKPAECTNCVATNVLATEENEEGIDAFLDRIGWECPYASDETSESGETGTRRLSPECWRNAYSCMPPLT